MPDIKTQIMTPVVIGNQRTLQHKEGTGQTANFIF